ncbi:aminotransferase class-III family protein, partial [Vibrio parahaemolyticus V-223/04]
ALVLSRTKSTTRRTQMRFTASALSKAYKRSTICLLVILNHHVLRRSSSSQYKVRAASTKHLTRLHKACVSCVTSTVSC